MKNGSILKIPHTDESLYDYHTGECMIIIQTTSGTLRFLGC